MRNAIFAIVFFLVATTIFTFIFHAYDVATRYAPASSVMSRDAPVNPMRLGYGVLGKPDPHGSSGFNAAFQNRSPQVNLAEFRWHERHPLQGTKDHFVRWDEFDEFADRQRALFYAAALRAPQLITQSDLKSVRSEEADLYASSCGARGSSGVRYELTAAQCIPYDIAEAKRQKEAANHVPTPEEKARAAREMAEAKVSMAAADDFFVTGSKTASAEWHSLKQEGVTCGITPAGRYIVVQNAIGTTRYDDPSGNDWESLGCYETEPVFQQQILAAQTDRVIKDYEFKQTHHIDMGCVMHQIKKQIDRQKADSDTCWRDGSTEQADAEVAAKHKTWQACDDQQVAAAQAAGNYEPLDPKVVEEACGKEPE